jgi:hypothetical protein
MTMVIDVTPFIGTSREVFEPMSGRTVTVSIGDAGPCPFWDHRPMLSLRVDFADGKRSHVATADAAAGIAAGELWPGYTTSVIGGGNWAPLMERHREKGAKNGGTSYTFTSVFQGVRDYSAHIEQITAGLPLEVQLKEIERFHRERSGVAAAEARFAAARAQYARR